jgi:phosphatidylglycerophosphate synthase
VESAPVYRSEDRSLLLPYYSRFLVTPLLPLIPRRVRPNTITHVGHLLCLVAAAAVALWQPASGPLLFVAMLLLQVYLLCDNLDGAHARRTEQCSTAGEYLDHGLDLLNSSYIGVMAAVAVGTTGVSTVVLMALVSGAASVTCWEQAETGVFRLGMLNQIESVLLVTVLLTVSAFDSSAFWERVHVGPITARLAIAGGSCLTILVGMARGILRVRAAKRPIDAPLCLLALFAILCVAVWTGHVATHAAVAMGLSGSVALGTRMLAARIGAAPARFSLPLAGGAVAVAAFVALGAAGAIGEGAERVGLPLAATVTVMFSALAARDLRAMIARLAQLGASEQAPARL